MVIPAQTAGREATWAGPGGKAPGRGNGSCRGPEMGETLTDIWHREEARVTWHSEGGENGGS